MLLDSRATVGGSKVDMTGKELNDKHRVFDDILTPEEIVEAGFVYRPTDDKNIDAKLRKLKHRFSHDWTDEEKKSAKKSIIEELKFYNSDIKFINKVYLTSFAPEFDYSNFCYDIGVLVRFEKIENIDIHKKADEWYNKGVFPCRREMQQDICAWNKEGEARFKEVITNGFYYGYLQALEDLKK